MSDRPASAVVILPKNRGLAATAAAAYDARPGEADAQRTLARGEDIPLLASDLARRGRDVVAYTGSDLLEEWLAAGNRLDPRLGVVTIPWNDPRARFGKPALCAIAPRGYRLAERGVVRAAYCARYPTLAQQYLATLATSERSIEPIAISGTVENALAYGMAEVMIDIVLTGSTIDAMDLEVLEVIFRSDLAMLVTR
ncbi:MAG: hypothetical protein KGN02_00955 [bacterium]|nr:hypothetical protein [bacterium]